MTAGGQFPGSLLDRFSRRILERAGIHNDYQLCKLDPFEVYVRVLKSQGTANLDFFYNLLGWQIGEDPKELAKNEWVNTELRARLAQEEHI